MVDEPEVAELPLKNGGVVLLDKKGLELLPDDVPHWRKVTHKGYLYVVGHTSYGMTHTLTKVLFDYIPQCNRIKFLNGNHLDMRSCNIEIKKNRSGKRKSTMSKARIHLNGCILARSYIEGSRCEPSYKCRNYDSCLWTIGDTTWPGWVSDLKGYVRA